MRNRDVGKVRIDSFYNLIIVICEFLKLGIKVIQTGDELHLRRIASDDNELLPEDYFDDKPAAVMLRSGFAEQFVEADVLLFIEAERVFIAQRSGLLSGLVCQFSVSIQNIGSKGVRLGERPASQSEDLCRTNANLSDKGTARCCLAITKIRAGESLTEVSKILRCGFRSRVCCR